MKVSSISDPKFKKFNIYIYNIREYNILYIYILYIIIIYIYIIYIYNIREKMLAARGKIYIG